LTDFIKNTGPLTDDELRIEKLKKLIRQEKLITTGDMILDGVGGKPLFSFIQEAGDVVNLCSPFGLVVCEAKEFYIWCKDYAKTEFIKNIDRIIRNREMTLTGSPLIENGV
jgi:hypothetical protein